MQLISNTLTAIGVGGNVYGKDDGVTVWTHSAQVTGTGAVSATVVIEAQLDPSGAGAWFTLATITLAGTNSAIDAVSGMCAPYAIRHRVSAISGAGASVAVFSSGA